MVGKGNHFCAKQEILALYALPCQTQGKSKSTVEWFGQERYNIRENYYVGRRRRNWKMLPSHALCKHKRVCQRRALVYRAGCGILRRWRGFSRLLFCSSVIRTAGQKTQISLERSSEKLFMPASKGRWENISQQFATSLHPVFLEDHGYSFCQALLVS